MGNDRMLLAVSGSLMRGLELNPLMLEAGGGVVSETFTAPVYRLWSIRDAYPGMAMLIGEEQGSLLSYGNCPPVASCSF
jgi:gamma-glutamylcyclotransferase (GGCT)/AIG2-like uncharacterized protein YtfP